MPRPHLELLSPARDADIGIAAIDHGADAVYIGGPGFGARDKASNPIEDIERLVRHAHRFHARIFVTLNTILRDDELEPARRLAWRLHEAGVDALIMQDMGLLELDMPPMQLHASTQTDIRTPEKAGFLQDVGFSQMVLARELDLGEIRAIAGRVQDAVLEFFVHGALCVAYSGQCFISHAHTGRSANRGNCSQECRLPYTVLDAAGRVVAHDKHVLSLKDNDQSANLEALVDAGIRSFKIEGRYKDVATVKNVTAHYRLLLDAILERRPGLARASSGRCTYTFEPQPEQGFNRGGTDYFVNGRKQDIGAFDTPKHAGLPVGHVVAVTAGAFDVETDPGVALHNGDALTWYDLQGELRGVQANTVEPLAGGRWRVVPQLGLPSAGDGADARSALRDLRAGTALSRNRDAAWERLLSKPSSERRIAVDLTLATWRRDGEPAGLELALKDEDGFRGVARLERPLEPPRDPQRAEATLREQLSRLGATDYAARRVRLAVETPWFVPASVLNALRRDAVEALDAARAAGFEPLPRARPVEPPVPYPEDTLSYLANVYNGKAAEFYARHGVKVVGAAYESHEELGEVSLMITKHCVRFSLSLCPKQAKGVTGVQGTVRAEPLVLQHGEDRITLRFDCKPCEMHVVGAMRRNVLRQLKAEPVTFYRTRPATA
ncbi:MAG: U32 family peptidase [Burkholderiaceae bacterium]|jgi:putative protease|nr:U32 family peptidase [Burkholderiales bacterium]MCZ8340003.1 U32 family peptidase [Burkholderiaceae bacterium]